MGKFLNYLKQLFSSSADRATSSAPFLHEPLDIDEETEAEVEEWTGSLRMRRLFDWLHQQYTAYRAEQQQEYDMAIDFLNVPSSKGFVIHLAKASYSFREMQLLLHYLKKRLLKLEYKSSVSDQRSFRKNGSIHTIMRHYLKPNIRPRTDSKSDQKFGNITIELIVKNDEPAQFLFSASTYSDHKYEDAQPFEELMEFVLKREI